MQKDDRFYTFLLKKSSRKKIYIRRIEISKKRLHSGIAAALLSTGILTIGVAGFLKTEGFDLAKNQNTLKNSAFTQQVSLNQTKSASDTKALNYDRPGAIGGPSTSFRLTNVGIEEENEMESQLRTIEASSRPENLPTIWAHMGKINNEYGFRRNPFGGRSYEFHGGLDIAGEKGDMVVAPANGVVTKAGWQGGYGNLIEIDHGNGLVTRYGHLSKIDVQNGDTVQRGQLMGLVGSTGRSTGPHLHFEIRLNDKPINPRRFLPPEMPK